MKPDIKELLELAKEVRVLHPDFAESSREYVTKISPDKMIALLEYVRDLESVLEELAPIPEKLLRGKPVRNLDEVLQRVNLNISRGKAND